MPEEQVYMGTWVWKKHSSSCGRVLCCWRRSCGVCSKQYIIQITLYECVGFHIENKYKHYESKYIK